MPTYEYACKSCGQHLEVVQSFKDTALTECPNCGGQLRKVFGNIGITFKGSGFYKTDSRSDRKSSASASKSDTGKADTGKAESSKSESSSAASSTSSSSGSSGSASSSSGSGSRSSAVA